MILCILKGTSPFKMHKIIFFPRKKKYVCLPFLKSSDPLPETHLYFFYLTLCWRFNPFHSGYLQTGTSANSEDLDEMLHNGVSFILSSYLSPMYSP